MNITMIINQIISMIIPITIFLGIPLLFLYAYIKNVVKIFKIRKKNEKVEKKLLFQTIFYGLLLIAIVVFWIWIDYALSRAVAMM